MYAGWLGSHIYSQGLHRPALVFYERARAGPDSQVGIAGLHSSSFLEILSFHEKANLVLVPETQSLKLISYMHHFQRRPPSHKRANRTEICTCSWVDQCTSQWNTYVCVRVDSCAAQKGTSKYTREVGPVCHQLAGFPQQDSMFHACMLLNTCIHLAIEIDR